MAVTYPTMIENNENSFQSPLLADEKDNSEVGAKDLSSSGLASEEGPSEDVDVEDAAEVDLARPPDPRCGFAFTLCGVCTWIAFNVCAFQTLTLVLVLYFALTGSDYEDHRGSTRKYHPYDDDEDDAITLKVKLILAFATVTNLATIWYLCRPSEAGRRILKAGVAVFRCCDRSRRYERELIPLQILFLRGCLTTGQNILSFLKTTLILLLPLLVLGPLLAWLLFQVLVFHEVHHYIYDEDLMLVYILILLSVVAALYCIQKKRRSDSLREYEHAIRMQLAQGVAEELSLRVDVA